MSPAVTVCAAASSALIISSTPISAPGATCRTSSRTPGPMPVGTGPKQHDVARRHRARRGVERADHLVDPDLGTGRNVPHVQPNPRTDAPLQRDLIDALRRRAAAL